MAVKVTRIHTCGHHFTRTIHDTRNMEEIKPRMLCKCHKCMLSAQHIHQKDRDELHSIFECVKHDSEKKIRKGLFDAEQCAASVLIEYCAAVAQTMNMSREDRLRWLRWQNQCGEWCEVGGLTPPHDVVEIVPQSLIKGVRYVSAHG